ncbi:hypothetical protein D9980_08865 [Serratia sp. 3ACOL1]|nr:hypothetical protein D9980_08865 [Serratia sp. 3ACOL1]
MPRLSGCQSLYTDITLNIAAKTDPLLLSGSGFDAAIHFEHPAWAGMRRQVLFEERLVPVCHPDLLTDKNIFGQLNVSPDFLL